MRPDAAHIAAMATSLTHKLASCTSYAYVHAAYFPDPPELDYRHFTPEFMDELDEYYTALAVSQVPA